METGGCLREARCNMAVGTRYLREQLAAFDGSLVWALAAYNAGPQRARRWRARFGGGDPVEAVDRIPIRETRDYVGKVLAAMWRRGAAQAPGRSATLAQIQGGAWPGTAGGAYWRQ